MGERVETTSIIVSYGPWVPTRLNTFSILRDLARNQKRYPPGLNAYGQALYNGERDRCDRLWVLMGNAQDENPFPKIKLWKGWRR
ncbi:MAG TPA: hypothetical protein VGK83_05165 [Acidimicrobiia bacterium]